MENTNSQYRKPFFTKNERTRKHKNYIKCHKRVNVRPLLLIHFRFIEVRTCAGWAITEIPS